MLADSARRASPHVHTFHVRFGDLDPLNHVNNVAFLTYLQDARVEMLHTGPVRDGGAPLRGLVIARHEIDYLRPLLFSHHPVRVETTVRDLANVKFTLAYRVRDDDHVYATAMSVMVAYDVKDARPRRLTAAEREFLAGYLEPVDAAANPVAAG